MKVVERVLDHQSNLGGERVGMSIDQSALAHIMSVLTDLYSDPELAVIREYSTNALDAQVEAGVKCPIEVTLPSPLSPFFRVRDYGVGLDADGIRDVYSQYGTSTKRDSNDVVGMLGLGCKSALTYTDQFTLTGIKDGIMTQVSVSRDEDGSGSMTIVAQHPTDQPSGVEVVIPAKRHNAFEAKAHQFFKFWQDGTVKVNGETPRPLKSLGGLWLNDSLFLTKGVDQSYVVMGNVAYPIPDGLNPAPQQAHRYGVPTHKVVAYVPIGAVQFTPSREALQMTKLTKETLAGIKAEVTSKLHGEVQSQVAAAKDAKEARRIAREGASLGVANLIYKTRTVSDSLVRLPSDQLLLTRPEEHPLKTFLVAGSDSYRRKSGDRSWSVSLDANYDRDTMWFTGFTGAELTNYKRQKLDVYRAQHGISDSVRMVFVNRYTPDEMFWLEGETIHDWATVDAIKITAANAANVNGRPKGAYTGYVDGTWSEKILAETIDTTKPIVWLQGNGYAVPKTPEVRAGIVDFTNFAGYIIALPQNRIDKFCRDFPTAKSLTDYGKEFIETYLSKLDKADVEAARFQVGGADFTRLAALDAAKVDDPAMKVAIIKAQHKVPTIVANLTRWGRWIPFKAEPNPASKYPLLPMNLKSLTAHCYIYLNAAYAAERS